MDTVPWTLFLLLVGLALAIGKPFNPDQPWVGAPVVGLLVLGGLLVARVVAAGKIAAYQPLFVNR